MKPWTGSEVAAVVCYVCLLCLLVCFFHVFSPAGDGRL